MGNFIFMQRCLDLSRNGSGSVSPNPMVGCVIVRDNVIVGEGYHDKFGAPHAEVNAINSVKDKELLKDSTLYVNLEPCAHFGKTPPCTDLIIAHGIPRVVIANPDPFERVAGKGITKLRNAGIDVVTGIMKKEGREINKRFFTFHEKKRPYIILKWAQTIDGFIDKCWAPGSRPNKPTWITGQELKTLVHKWRTEEDAIMVGTNTARNDNPRLDAREWPGKNALRIVLDKDLKLPLSLSLFDGSVPTVVFTEKNNTTSVQGLEFLRVQFNEYLIESVLDILYKRQVLSLIVEGGSILHNSFIKNGLWDEARLMTGNQIFESGVKAPTLTGNITNNYRIAGDNLIIIKNKI